MNSIVFFEKKKDKSFKLVAACYFKISGCFHRLSGTSEQNGYHQSGISENEYHVVYFER